MVQETPARYWTASQLGGRTIVLMSVNLPEDPTYVLNAYIKSGYLVTRVEKYYDGRIVKTKGV